MARHSAAAGRQGHGGAAGAVLAAAGCGQLPRTAHHSGGRQLRRRHRQRCAGVSECFRADSRWCGGACNMEQAEGGRLGGRKQARGRRHRPGAVHGHHAGGQQRDRRAGRAVLSAPARGLLQRYSVRDSRWALRRSNSAGRQGMASAGRSACGRRGGAADMAKPVRCRRSAGQQRPRGAHDPAARPFRRTAPR